MKYNNKQVVVNKQAINLYSLVQDVFAVFSAEANQKNIVLVNEVLDSKFVSADYDILSTIINNLISNAVKFSSSGVIQVSAELPVTGEGTVLTVSDQGTGMNEETLDVINEVLSGNLRALKITDKINTGLGYIIITELSKLHHISVSVKSELHKGTVVKVVIPG